MVTSKSVFRERSPLIACTVSGTVYTLYTCPQNCVARVPLVFIANANGTVSVVMKIYKVSTASSYYVIGGKNLGTGEFIQLSDNTGLVLEAGDKIEVTATGATVVVDALCTVIEQFKPIG